MNIIPETRLTRYIITAVHLRLLAGFVLHNYFEMFTITIMTCLTVSQITTDMFRLS